MGMEGEQHPVRDSYCPGAAREADKNTPRLRLEEEVKERRSSKGSEKSEKRAQHPRRARQPGGVLS